ncbi:phage minor head protein [Entomohabitans teleogrylli]|uniref:phage minor head protein n=1 Tax=Entomohabitans teleogrylli TaxID=1384589 RepID=UPI00073DAA68|nr:phage minor head protein [Entomohabitans teleogrylli]
MKKKPKSPVLPGNPKDPTGVDRLERGAMKAFAERMKRIRKVYIDILERIPASPAVNQRYAFDLDVTLLTMLLNNASLNVDELLYGSTENNWFWSDYVSTAYQRGTAQEFANLSRQSAVYAAGQQNLQTILISAPFRKRMALLRARLFEEMRGLSADVKANMARILTDGLGRGQAPRDIAKRLTEQTGIESRRANRIARTEITTALRRARWDESDDATEQYGIKSRLMHISALSPTTRATHAARHAHLYTTDDVREWYSTGANAINCKCSQISVLVDDDGKPLDEKVIERARKTFNTIRARGYEWAED